RSSLSGTRTGAAQYSVSQNGSLLYAPGSTEPDERNSAVWVDDKGVVTPIGIERRQYTYARVSPNGRYVSLSTRDGVWLYDTVQDTLENQPGISSIFTPAEWSPDGSRFAFGVVEGAIGIYLKELTSSNIKRLVSSAYTQPVWTPDGRGLAVLSGSAS